MTKEELEKENKELLAKNEALEKENIEFREANEKFAADLKSQDDENTILEDKVKILEAEKEESDKTAKEFEDYKAKHQEELSSVEKTNQDNHESIVENRKAAQDFSKKKEALNNLTKQFQKDVDELMKS